MLLYIFIFIYFSESDEALQFLIIKPIFKVLIFNIWKSIQLILRILITCFLWSGMFAIPPLLHIRLKPTWKESHSCLYWFRTWLKDIDWIGRATPCCNIWDKATANSPPTWLLASPSQARTRPRQLFTIKEPATWSNHAITKMTSFTGMYTPMFLQHCFLPWLEDG